MSEEEAYRPNASETKNMKTLHQTSAVGFF